MTCQGPVTQLYISKEGKSGLALREMSQGSPPSCPASCKRQTNTYFKAKTMPGVYKILLSPPHTPNRACSLDTKSHQNWTGASKVVRTQEQNGKL